MRRKCWLRRRGYCRIDEFHGRSGCRALSDLTEAEIFSCLDANLTLAIDQCRILAITPERGIAYVAFREAMDLLDGCCQQASTWREDTRWLMLGQAFHSLRLCAHRLLMGEQVQNSIERILLAAPHALWAFNKMADNLEGLKIIVGQIRHARVGRAGMILPDMPVPHRDTKPSRVILPAGMMKTNSGAIQAAGQALQ